jgi:hypothetical protein
MRITVLAELDVGAAGDQGARSCLLGAPVASVLVPLEGTTRADVAPGEENGAILLVAGRVEDVAKIDGLAQTILDSLDERGICVLTSAHR